MSVSDPTGTTVVELSRAEQWVVHHVLLDAIGLADGVCRQSTEATDDTASTLSSLAAIEKLESGDFAFTPEELDHIRRTCGAHASATEATADRNLATAVAERIDWAIADARP